MSSRKKKKQIISACNFLLTPEKCVADTSTPLFKIFTPLFCCSLSFKEYRNPLVRINKMVKNIVYKYSLSYLFTPFSALSLANIFVEFLCQTCISHHGLESFSNQWCSDCWKMYLWVKKKLRVDIFTHPLSTSKQNSPAGSCHFLLTEGS